ncbi:MAG: Zn-dependent protease with chaperone function [Hyphomicrobiaceae bacterium]
MPTQTPPNTSAGDVRPFGLMRRCRVWFASVLLGVILPFSFGCSVLPPLLGDPPKVSVPVPDLLAGACPASREAAITKAGQVAEQWPLRRKDNVSAYALALAKIIAAANPEAASMDWKIGIVRDGTPNVFSIGGSQMYLSEGMILAAQSEDELAAVIAHEMGHEIAGHFCAPLPRPAAGVETRAVADFVQVIDGDYERSADQVAIGLLNNAGFDPQALLGLTLRLSRSHADPTARRVLGARVDSLRAALSSVARKTVRRRENRDRLEHVKREIFASYSPQ